MTDAEWDRLLAAIRDVDDIDRAVAGCAELQSAATVDDVPRLVALLTDNSFFVREAAAWPLSDLGRVDALPQLLRAHKLGLDEGLDNDGLSAALADLVSANTTRSIPVLWSLSNDADASVRETALWLLGFCEERHDA